jgi:hypothetical protein
MFRIRHASHSPVTTYGQSVNPYWYQAAGKMCVIQAWLMPVAGYQTHSHLLPASTIFPTADQRVSHPGKPEFLTSPLWEHKNLTAFCTVILAINVH